MGAMHAQVYRAMAEAQLVGIVDLDVTATQAKLSAQGASEPVFGSLSALLHAVEVDIVDICGPTDQHVSLAVEAARAGKHLFIEKPLALDLDGCHAIHAVVRAAGVHAQVGHCIRFWPEYMALRDFIASGKGGALRSLSLQRRAARPGYSNQNWLNQQSRSGGAALDLHVHDTDFVLSLLGTPKGVTSQTSAGLSGPDHIFTLYDYDAVRVFAEGGWDYPPSYGFSMAYEAVLEVACVRYDSASGKPAELVLRDQAPQPLAVNDPASGESNLAEGNISSLGGYANELKYFLSCRERARAPEIATLEQATESVRVTLAEIASGQTRRPVTL